jgi:hypothetical protein
MNAIVHSPHAGQIADNSGARSVSRDDLDPVEYLAEHL